MVNRAIVLSITLLCGAAGVVRANRPESAPLRTNFDQFPMQMADWSGHQQPPMASNILRILNVDDYLDRVYLRKDHAIAGLYIGYYKSQRQGDSIHSPQNCLPGAGWEPLEQGAMVIPTRTDAGPENITVNRSIIQKGIERQLVLYWYQSHGRVVASEYWSKFYLVRDAVRMNRTDAALVRVIVPIQTGVDSGEKRAEEQAIDFVKDMFPTLPPYLPS